ncbi:transglutaminase-like domain-containing protein [Tahibacter sp. P2K]|uniref:Transglutaminase-like domain-containing protein n=2 Tax=Tahibacter harae TaxID=2963937 RepID=A0ABT1QWT0_9GAMM|nr:transglutaminase-like domain-containing protein [Tahibacter harae]MCQ4166744.1 transglutaminase-like domain-containing protein [Tahibacter harae]
MSFEEGAARLVFDLDALRAARSDADFAAAVKSAHAWLRTHSSQPARPRFDPDKLAFGSRGERVRAPAADARALRQAFDGIGVAALEFAAAAGVKDGPVAADLAPTEDVQLTAAIRAKAQELGATPLALLRYVHDTVQFIPSYGSIQGSDYTLQTARGNAFDQASLLIALLRASNIPARYVYGTIEVPVAQVMNWVGGVSEPRAALSLLAQGGIPNLGVTEGGVIKTVRLEHVWVETWTNQFPGGGMRAGSGDNWVALDPAFKQYDATPGLQIDAQVQFDMDGLIEHMTQTSTSNAAEGWVQGLDTDFMTQHYRAYGDELRSFVAANKPDATFAEVYGSRQIRPIQLRGLPAGLPYRTIATTAPVSALPGHLRWQFRFSIGERSFLGELENETVMIQRSLPQLAGKLLALNFRPASAADEATLAGYVPPGADGPEDLPSRFPANIVRLVPQFSIDGQSISDAPALGLGIELITRKGLYVPGRDWEETDNPFSVGDYQAVGIDTHGISEAQGARLRAAMETTKARLENGQGQGLTQHDVTGAMMQSAVLGYFARTWAQDGGMAAAKGLTTFRLPSYGTVSTSSRVSLLFGTPRLFAPTGVLMDMDRMAVASVSNDGNSARRDYFAQVGGRAMSASENGVLEDLFSRPGQRLQGTSAVQAIAQANVQGQRIYTIAQDNAASAMPALNLDVQTESDIASAVQAGKVVTVHQSLMNIAHQSGVVGYIVSDPETGAASYLISGSADGGALGTSTLIGLAAAHLLAILAAVFVGGLVSLMFVVAMALMIIGFAIAMIAMAYANEFWCNVGLNIGFGGVGFETPPGLIMAIVFTIAGAFANSWAGQYCSGPSLRAVHAAAAVLPMPAAAVGLVAQASASDAAGQRYRVSVQHAQALLAES